MSDASTRAATGIEVVLTSADIRALEARFADADLMRRAGKAAGNFLLKRTTRDARIMLFAGPGNNGGDALACAAELVAAGHCPEIVMLGTPEKLPVDAHAAWLR